MAMQKPKPYEQNVPKEPNEPKKPRGQGKVPESFKTRNHRVSHQVARRLRLGYIKKYANKPGALITGAYNRKIFEKILGQQGCIGIRFYPGLDGKGKVTLLFCGIDRYANDILAGTIGDIPVRCPPMCSAPNGVLRF
jgi:hypothetical protein